MPNISFYGLPLNNVLMFDQMHTNQNFSGQKLSDKEYDSCSFIGCDFTKADISVITFVSCVFKECNFTGVMMKQTAFQDECLFEDCKLLGADFAGCNEFMFSAEFVGCMLNYASFSSFELKNTQFSSCKLQEVDFTDAVINGSVFKNCDLTNAVFENTKADKVDFSTAFNFSIDPERNTIKKATFSKEGLLGLLKKYDLVVK